jgi:DHA3 family multidrug efflux protein-like MFS transporter
MKTFYHLLANSVIMAMANNFIWFVVTFWVYLETKSVIATSILGGLYLVINMTTAFWFGSIVDHNDKKRVMLLSNLASFVFFGSSLLVYLNTSREVFTTITSPQLWVVTTLILLGVIAGGMRQIALSTSVTLLVAEDMRDRANGLVGGVTGAIFAIGSFASGLMLAYTGLAGSLITGLVCIGVAIAHLAILRIPELRADTSHEEEPKKVDIKGTIAVISAVPGLFALIFFATFNNFLGGVFMSLMDAYGLTLVSVEVWGILWGVLSFGFIVGGLFVAKYGLGSKPLRTLLLTNVVMWIVCMFFAIQASIVLLAIGMLIYMILIPFAEASEQTILQKVVPVARQGRVFGFAQSVESAASPLSAFFIGPIAQFIFIPFMTTGAGVTLIGDWFGVGQGRGIALVFTIVGIVGLIITLLALRSKHYHKLSDAYAAPTTPADIADNHTLIA